eukprot:scaffold90928_cov52-Prasinocladus_malaysianus.AAC.1
MDHRWYYYPEMLREEALLLKQWDSTGLIPGHEEGTGKSSRSMFSLHSAFSDPATTEDAPDRESIEVRCVVLFP